MAIKLKINTKYVTRGGSVVDIKEISKPNLGVDEIMRYRGYIGIQVTLYSWDEDGAFSYVGGHSLNDIIGEYNGLTEILFT